MKTAFLALLLISVASAQDLAETQRAQAPVPQLDVFQRYSEFRQGRDQEVLIVLCAQEPGCPGCRFTVTTQTGGFVPLEFKLESSDGLSISYRKGTRYKPALPGSNIALRNDDKVIALKIHSRDDLPLGKRTLRGQLTYAVAVGQSGLQGTKEFEIPLQIVSHDAKVSQSDWPYASHVRENLVSALLLPLVPFEYLLLFIACHRGCDL